jgi:hypothetical protein
MHAGAGNLHNVQLKNKHENNVTALFLNVNGLIPLCALPLHIGGL